MGIFIGHGQREADLGVPGLFFSQEAEEVRIRFCGHLLTTDDPSRYFQSEILQSEATLSEAAADLVYREGAPGVGELSGVVEFAGERIEVATPAFRNAPMARTRGAQEGVRLFLSRRDGGSLRVDAPAGGGDCEIRSIGEGGWGEQGRPGRLRCDSEVWVVEPEGAEPMRLVLAVQTSLLRPVAPKVIVRTTMGFLRIEGHDEVTGGGFFEQRHPLEEGLK